MTHPRRLGRTLLRKPRNDALGADHQSGPSRAERAELDAKASERTCVLSRRTAPRDELIRLALGPDGQVAPDIRARADGRGAWIGVGRAALETAHAKGKLKAALARAFKTGELAIPDDLGQRIEDALQQAALDRLGLEARGGALLAGGERIEQAARGGQVHLLIHASDAGEDGNRRLDQAWRVGGSEARGFQRGLVFPLPRSILSMALGRENVVHVALTDAGAARRVANAIARWQAFIDPDAGLDGAPARDFGANRPGLLHEHEDEGHS
jgi:predicted RNA-binding protein YlxR (DUF448 family)